MPKSCICDGSSDTINCPCNAACNVYAACSCVSTCYSQGGCKSDGSCGCNAGCYGNVPCTCNTTAYFTSCGCDAMKYAPGVWLFG